MKKIGEYVVELFSNEGYAVVVPMLDPRLSGRHPEVEDRSSQAFYTSNWSERHVGYVCGIGTFGLSDGLISSVGVAGRLLSIITDAYFEPSDRDYSDIYEYCTHCGTCMQNCPAEAISEKGKSHPPCSAFLDQVMDKCSPFYGCGKCQVNVPCESTIPAVSSRMVS